LATTTNLGLTTYDTASGSATTFETYRLAVAGNSSNMSIIDNFAGATSASVVILRGNALFNVNASEISTNYYEATTTAITGYNTNLMINLVLNTTISGSASLNINSYGIKSLFKVGSSGSLTNMVSGDLLLNRYYQFIYNGTYFVLMGSTSGETTTISGSGIMSDTAGSSVKHNVSGISTGSYTRVTVDLYGHITGGSSVTGMSGSLTFYSGSASGGALTLLNTVNITNGLITSWTQA